MKVEIDNVSFEIQLLPFRSEGNSEYTLVDACCILELLRQTRSYFCAVEKQQLKLAVLEKTILEVAEHLSRSKKSRREENVQSFCIDGAAYNLRKILLNGRIRKIANPTIPEKRIRDYKQYREDMVLAYALTEGNFKAIATKDGPLSKRLGKGKFISCNLLLNDRTDKAASKGG